MKHFTSFFCTCLLFLLMSGGTAKAQDWNYYMTDGTENDSKTGLTSGYYILSVQGLYDEGLLYWSEEQQANSNLLISSTKYTEKTNKILDKSSSEDVAFIWYLNVDTEQNTFTIQSVKSGKFLSYTGVSGEAAANVVVPTVEDGDASIAKYTINYTHNAQEPGPLTINGKKHFILKLANATYNGSTNAFLHVNGTSDRVTNPHPMFADWHLEHRTGFNTNLDNTPTSEKMYSCARFAFFKLSEAAAFTYDYKINGTSVKTEEKVVKIGDSYPALATADFCTATALDGSVARADHNQTKDITVTWSAPFQFSTTINNAHWYHMKFGGNQRFVVNTGANQAIPLAAAEATHTTASTEQWAFVGNPFDGFKVYNRRKQGGAFGRLAASTTMLPTSGQRIGNDTEVTVHYGELAAGTTDIYDALTVTNNVTIDNSFFLCQHGETSKKMNWTTGTDVPTQRIAFWTGGQGNNSAFTVQEPTLPELPLTAIGDNTYGTYYIDYPIAVPDNVNVYTGDVDLVNKRISMRLANEHIIPAETGVVLVGNNSSVTTCTLTTNGEAGSLEKGSLTGSLEATTIDLGYHDTFLVFGRSNGQLGFYKPVTSILSIPANKAFIRIPKSQVQGLALNFDGTTTDIAIEDILAPEKQNEGTCYDLSGRRVSKPTKGCYIRNGKKIYIK
ncbi:MAG: hypothetical protein ACI3X8_04860 [Alloprevotella sp.]